MRRLAIAMAATALNLVGCDRDAGGEPVVRDRVDGKRDTAATSTPGATGPAGTAQVESACRSIIFENTSLTHCLAIPARHTIRMVLGPAGRAPYGSLSAFAADTDASRTAFAMNAGMFDDEGQPIGYFVSESQRIKSLNTNEGSGNFHMKPNGVFYGSDGSWAIRTTEDFLTDVEDRPEFGTQSGPMLVIGGRIHPEITTNGPSRFVRNAVGVDDQGRAHFVISNAPLSFGRMARFFRDELKTANALYLDGTVSSLWNPATSRLDTGAPIGPIVVVERRDPGS